MAPKEGTGLWRACPGCTTAHPQPQGPARPSSNYPLACFCSAGRHRPARRGQGSPPKRVAQRHRAAAPVSPPKEKTLEAAGISKQASGRAPRRAKSTPITAEEESTRARRASPLRPQSAQSRNAWLRGRLHGQSHTHRQSTVHWPNLPTHTHHDVRDEVTRTRRSRTGPCTPLGPHRSAARTPFKPSACRRRGRGGAERWRCSPARQPRQRPARA